MQERRDSNPINYAPTGPSPSRSSTRIDERDQPPGLFQLDVLMKMGLFNDETDAKFLDMGAETLHATLESMANR